MSADVTSARWYLVFLDEQAPDARPVGAARQVLDDTGEVVREEGVGRDGDWGPTEVFRLQWIGRYDHDLVEVPREQAEAWIEGYRERLAQRAREDDQA